MLKMRRSENSNAFIPPVNFIFNKTKQIYLYYPIHVLITSLMLYRFCWLFSKFYNSRTVVMLLLIEIPYKHLFDLLHSIRFVAWFVQNECLLLQGNIFNVASACIYVSFINFVHERCCGCHFVSVYQIK